MTNISEVVEYVLLPDNDDIVKPRAHKTFLDGLAELGINRRLIQNKRIYRPSGSEHLLITWPDQPDSGRKVHNTIVQEAEIS